MKIQDMYEGNLKYTIKKPKKERCQKDAQWSPKPQSFSYNPQQPPTSQQPQQVPFHVNGKPLLLLYNSTHDQLYI